MKDNNSPAARPLIKIAKRDANFFVPLPDSYLRINPDFFVPTAVTFDNKNKKSTSQTKSTAKNATFAQWNNSIRVVGEEKRAFIRKNATSITNRKLHKSIQFQQPLQFGQNQVLVTGQRVTSLSCSLKFAPTKQKTGHFYYQVGLGNNSHLIEKVLSFRGNWKKTNITLFHFKWQQNRNKLPPNSITRFYNHLPNHESISNKGKLFQNLKAYCQRKNIKLFQIVPVCFYLDFDLGEVCQEQLKKFVKYYFEYRERYRQRTSEHTQDSQRACLTTMQSKERANLLRKSPQNRKNYSPIKLQKQQIKTLYKNLLVQLKDFHDFQDLSQTKKQKNNLMTTFDSIYGKDSLWILKPTDLNRGRGIKIFRSLSQLGQIVKKQFRIKEKGSIIIQKYIQKPMLIAGRKFDIRLWSMITDNRQVFLFKQGYIRTSSEIYNLHSKSEYAHLTNNAIQKFSSNYGQFQQGNQLPLHYLYANNMVERENFFNQVRRIVTIVSNSALDKIFYSVDLAGQKFTNFYFKCAPSTTKTFEIFGYDFMIDETGHVWLIEVNTNPCLQESSSLLRQLIPRMIHDSFKLTLDKIFSKNINMDIDGHCSVSGYSDNENMWEKIDLGI